MNNSVNVILYIMRHTWIGFITTLIVVVLIEVSLITKSLLPNIFPINNEFSTQNIHIKTDMNVIPPLPSGFFWKEVSPTNHDSIFYTDRNSLLFEKKGKVIISNLSGKEWTSIKNINTKEELDNYDFMNSYSEALQANGWTNTLNFRDMFLQAITADGPTGGIIGYLKSFGDVLRIVILSQSVTNFNDKEFPFGCPCTHTYRVFLSNPIRAENLQIEVY